MVEISVSILLLAVTQLTESNSVQAIYPTVVVILVANSVSQTDTVLYAAPPKQRMMPAAGNETTVLSTVRFEPGSVVSSDLLTEGYGRATTSSEGEEKYSPKGGEQDTKSRFSTEYV